MKTMPSLCRGILSIAMFVILCGCVPSLQPFYTAKDVLFDPALAGTFMQDKAVWTFAKAEEKAYKLVIRDDGNSSTFAAHLFQLGEVKYIDLYPSKDSLDDCQREDFFRASVVPGHLVLKVVALDATTLKLQVMDQDGLKERLKAKGSVPHAWIEDDRLVFTGSTEQMQGFLREISSDAKAWGNPAEFKKK